MGRNPKITRFTEPGGAAVASYPRAYELGEKAACWHKAHKPWLSLASLLLEHQASQTKFSKIPNQAGQWANLQGRWSGIVPAAAFSSSSGVCLCVKISPDWSWHPQTRELPGQRPQPGGNAFGPSVSALAFCNLLLDAQLEGLLHGWIQRRVCRHLLAHPSWIIVLRGGRVRKLRVWPLPERTPALSLDCALKELHLTHTCQACRFPGILRDSDSHRRAMSPPCGPRRIPVWRELCSEASPGSLCPHVEQTLPSDPDGNSGSGAGSGFYQFLGTVAHVQAAAVSAGRT